MPLQSFLSVEYPSTVTVAGAHVDRGLTPTVSVTSGERRCPPSSGHVGLNHAEARYNRRARSPSLGSSLSITVSEQRAADAFRKLERFVEYDRKWRYIREEGRADGELQLSFSEFPWPSLEPFERGEFLRRINRTSVTLFLFDAFRLRVREVDKLTLTEHEKMNWVTDREVFARRLQGCIIKTDTYLVREAHAIVALYVRGASDNDDLIMRHRAEFERALRTYPSAPPIVALAGVSIMDIMRRRKVERTSGMSLRHPASSKRLDPGLKRSPSGPQLERSDSSDSLFSQADTITFGSSQPITSQTDPEKKDQGPTHHGVDFQLVPINGDSKEQKLLFLPSYSGSPPSSPVANNAQDYCHNSEEFMEHDDMVYDFPGSTY